MKSGNPELPSFARVSGAERRRGDRLRQAVAMAVFRGLAPWYPRAAFDRALQRIASRDRRFAAPALPAPLALRCFGERLKISVSSAAINLVLHDWIVAGDRHLHVDRFFVAGGNWSSIAGALSENAVVKEAVELHEAGLDYRATRIYRHYLACAKEGRPIRRNWVQLASETMVDAYFEGFVALFESIKAHGLLRRGQRGGAVGRAGWRPWAEWVEQDIGVAVGAEGELYKLPGGQHRTAIARVLGLAAMPVQVRLIHQRWLRRALEQAGLSPAEAVAAQLRRLELDSSGSGVRVRET